MNKTIENDIRKLLKIKSTDTSERLVKYKRYRDAYAPVMFGLFIMPCVLSAFGVIMPELALLLFLLNMHITSVLGLKVRMYEIDKVLKKDIIDTVAIKQQLSNYETKDIYKAKKVWGVLRWIYACFFFVSQLILLFCLAFTILDGYGIGGIAMYLFYMLFNHSLHDGIKVRSRVYKVLVLLDEYDNESRGIYAGEQSM